MEAGSIFAETHNAAVRASLVDSERIAALLENVTLTQDWERAINRASSGHGQDFVSQLKQVANIIAGRVAFEAERDIFYIELGGFDLHSDLSDKLDAKYRDVNVGLEYANSDIIFRHLSRISECSTPCGAPYGDVLVV